MSTELKIDNTRFHDHEIVSPFDKIRRVRSDGSEYWTAREMMGPLGYREDKWQNMESVVERAKISCNAMGHNASDHFTGVSKMVPVGSGAYRQVADVELTRYACSLVAMNGDPRKPKVAAAQQYFAVMTRVAELAAATPARSDHRLASIESVQSITAGQIRELLDDLDQMKRRLALVDAKASNAEHVAYGASGFQTLHVWARDRGVHLTPSRSRAEGAICNRVCVALGIRPAPYRRGDGKSVNMYPPHVLEAWFEGYRIRQSQRPSLFSA